MAILLGLAIGTILIGGWLLLRPEPLAAWQIRQQLFLELQPVALKNCTLERFGASNDGGYLICGNLLGEAQSAYFRNRGRRQLGMRRLAASQRAGSPGPTASTTRDRSVPAASSISTTSASVEAR